MRDSFPFLVRLGLQADAKATDIRRAYARELKKIDQVNDPAGFQQLREAYEIALRWHASPENVQDRIPQEEPKEEAQAAPAPEDSSPPANTQELADQVLQKLLAGTGDILQRAESRHQRLWKTALHDSLNDDRLLSIVVRTAFEERIVHLLASGWQPGHESLFLAANEVFGWEKDRRRIVQFGEAGAMLDKAIDEWKLFESMTPYAIGKFRKLLGLVNITRQPTLMISRSDLLLFHQMASHFYHWLALTIERETLENWCEFANAESRRNPEEQNAASRSIWLRPIIFFPIALMTLALLMGLLSLVISARTPKSRATIEPVAGETRVLEINQDGPPSRAQFDAVQDQVRYVPGRDIAPGPLRVRYQVEIDASGKVVKFWKLNASRDPLFDDAVADALTHATVFKPENQGTFRAWFDHTVR